MICWLKCQSQVNYVITYILWEKLLQLALKQGCMCRFTMTIVAVLKSFPEYIWELIWALFHFLTHISRTFFRLLRFPPSYPCPICNLLHDGCTHLHHMACAIFFVPTHFIFLILTFVKWKSSQRTSMTYSRWMEHHCHDNGLVIVPSF
jgi:hypothetical protein